MLQINGGKLKLLVSLMMLALAVSIVAAQKNGRTVKTPSLEAMFGEASKEFGVPSEILKTIAYSETHFDGHHGQPSQDNGFGLMHLVDNPSNQTLNRASAITGVPAEILKTDDYQNIRGGAAILKALATEENLSEENLRDIGAWYPIVARYTNAADDTMARFYADEAYKLLERGFSGTTPNGEEIIVVAVETTPQRGRYEFVPTIEESMIDSTDYGPALWNPAYSGNYLTSNRPTSSGISYVIIHTTQGSYAGTINWFKNSSSNVSAHYVIRSSDGQITQMVREKDIAYHVRSYNTSSIGIEHEGFVDNPSWYTDAMYNASAALTRNICQKYGLAMTRTVIKGHNEMPGNDHTDPGPNWNWTRYMQLVTQSGGGGTWETIVDNSNSGFSASANWGVSTYSSQKYGADYRYANPQPVSDAAWYSANLPSAGNYEVYVRYPANSGYSSSAPHVVVTSGGNVTVNVNQQINGGTWVSLGTHSMTAGSHQVVGVSRWTNATGYVIADAVRIVRR